MQVNLQLSIVQTFNVANTRLKQGFDSVTVGQDVNFYIDAINEMVHSIEK